MPPVPRRGRTGRDAGAVRPRAGRAAQEARSALSVLSGADATSAASTTSGPDAVRFISAPPDGALITMTSPELDVALGASIVAAPDVGSPGRHHRHQLQGIVT